MTPDQITKANAEIARICGWTRCECGNPACSLWFNPNGDAEYPPPNYFESHEACAEMRKCLTEEEQIYFVECLSSDLDARELTYQNIFKHINAAPVQQAMAFLGVKGKG